MLQYVLDRFNPTCEKKKLHFWHLIGRKNDNDGDIVSNELDVDELKDLLENTTEDVQVHIFNWCMEAHPFLKDH